jgi:hypothetical protein
MSRTPDLIVPGRHDHERRVFHHILDAFDLGGAVTSLTWFIGRQPVADPGTVLSPNPGFTHPTVATHVMVDWLVQVHTVAGDWTLTLHKNEAVAASATFTMVAGAALTHQKVSGLWSVEVPYDAADSYHLTAAGPSKNIVLARAVLRFEELS